MRHQEKNNKGWNTHLILFLPVAGALFPKKPVSKKPEENSLDFHLDMINKIDKLLAEYNPEPQSSDTSHIPPITPTSPRVPIEPRPSLNKTLSHREITWQPRIQQPQVITQIIPEEFKTELTINPEFRFITRKEFIDTISENEPSMKDHIEIIDLNSLSMDNTISQKNIDIIDLKKQIDETQSSFLINDVLDEKRHHKKIEIIDARTLEQKIYEEVFNASTKQTDEIDNKAKLYFLNSKGSSDKKQKKLEVEKAYIPDDFEERFRKLKEKQQQEEKINKLFKQDPKNIEADKTKSQEQKQGFFHREENTSKDIHHTETNRDIKELEKEQLRLRRLEERQARIEERLRKKQEKHALKIKQKQPQLEQKEDKKEQKIEKNIFPIKIKIHPLLNLMKRLKKSFS